MRLPRLTPGRQPRFTEAAQAVGRWIGRHGGQLVYGGGRSGLMGTVAEATPRPADAWWASSAGAGGQGVANQLCDELHVVTSMHERKAMMAERSDAFLALPGGIGTLEELFEVWTWRQLGYPRQARGPAGFTDGYYSGLMAFMQHAVKNGLMSEWQMGLIRTGTEPAGLLAALVQDAGLNATTIRCAT